MRGTPTQIAKYSRSTRFIGVLLAWLLVSSSVELPAGPKPVALAVAPDTPTLSVGAESEPCLSLRKESSEMKKKEESVPGEHTEDPDQQTHTPSADNAERHAKRWGDITIAAPKIWQ